MGRYQRAGQMNERADRAIIIRDAGRLVACRSRGCAARRFDPRGRMSAHAIEMHVSEREHESGAQAQRAQCTNPISNAIDTSAWPPTLLHATAQQRWRRETLVTL